MMSQKLTQEKMHELVAATPMGRLVRPDDVARTVAFFAGDDSGFTTGQYISLSGGVVMD
jgi:3-oxoacyl-[acyl-carrier protein] reductase